MTPAEFIATWQNTALNEEQGAQSWFNDLCDLVGHPKPTGDLDGLAYTYEQWVETGKADCYYENHFCWEFKTSEHQLNDAIGTQTIEHFNGELFAHVPDITLNTAALERLAEATEKNWSNIEPSIFGTLFERALGLTEERAPLGAHYTGEADIRRVVEPVILDDLQEDWQQALAQADAAKDAGDGAGAVNAMQAYRQRLAGVKTLDPACGSGNFLYVTLKALLDLERRAMDIYADEKHQAEVAKLAQRVASLESDLERERSAKYDVELDYRKVSEQLNKAQAGYRSASEELNRMLMEGRSTNAAGVSA